MREFNGYKTYVDKKFRKLKRETKRIRKKHENDYKKRKCNKTTI
jgi:hypothetical protein